MAKSSGRVAETKRRTLLVDSLVRLVKEKPLGTAGAVITLLLLFTGIFADFIAPYGMNETWIGDYLTPPSARFWFGTDNIGRDIFSRVIFGARISVIVGLSAAIISTVLSLIIGMLSAYFGGKFDLVVQRFVDVWMCFPPIVVLILIIAIIGPGILEVIVVLSINWGFLGTRIIRSAVISTQENVYVDAAKAIGCSHTRILIRHLLPNIMAPTVVLLSIRVPTMILTEASLSFLGFGIPPPTPSWGGMLSGSGRIYMYEAPWMALWPGLALAIVVYGVNMFGDAVRDILDPRLRGGIGRYGMRVKKEATAKSNRTLKQPTG